MSGRYGFGQRNAHRINLALLCVYIILVIVNLCADGLFATYVISIVTLADVGYLIFRIFSRNIEARAAENEKFSMILAAFTGFFKYNFRRIKDIRRARYRKCPHCAARIRLPIKKGKHTVLCPRCKNRFDVRILF